MAFLTDADYAVQIRTEIKTILTATNGSLSLAELMAQQEMTSYLKPRGIDCAAVFAATGANRNPVIIMYMIDMVLYHIHSSTPAKVMPKLREDRYNAAIAWLDKVNKSLLDPDLPYVQGDGTDATPKYKFGSREKYSQGW
ncbi:MAG: DUF1320 family protein [Sphingobacteriales bacterium]|nr:DUF1320 family protein [Sphingobacteriales bacterium]